MPTTTIMNGVSGGAHSDCVAYEDNNDDIANNSEHQPLLYVQDISNEPSNRTQLRLDNFSRQLSHEDI
jgi:hypothetical protein